MVSRFDQVRRFESYRFTFDIRGPIVGPQQTHRPAHELAVGDVTRTLMDPSLGIILQEEELKNLADKGSWSENQKLRLLEAEFANIQRSLERRGGGGTSPMIAIAFARKLRISVDYGRLLYVRVGPLVAEVSIVSTAVPAGLAGLLRMWQQAELAPPVQSLELRFPSDPVSVAQAKEFAANMRRLAEVEVVGPSTAKSMFQFCKSIGSPMLKGIERVVDADPDRRT